MSDLACDRCGRSLLAEEDVRYIVKLQIYAAYDPLELSPDRLRAESGEGEMARLIRQIESMSEDELQDQVYRGFVYDLCMRCQRWLLDEGLRGTFPLRPRGAPEPPDGPGSDDSSDE